MILDDEDRVFLVKHSYVPGWQMPGGGVEPGETIAAALEREVREEGNLELTASPTLHAIYYNTHELIARSRRFIHRAPIPAGWAAKTEL